jgi:hypothetical protein
MIDRGQGTSRAVEPVAPAETTGNGGGVDLAWFFDAKLDLSAM